MKIKLITPFILIFLFSCNKSKIGNKEDFGIPVEDPNLVMTPDNYSANSLRFINYQRKELQTVLPTAINDIVGVYKNLLIQVEKNKVYSTSADEQKKYLIEAQAKAFDSLLSKDIEVNQSYSALLDNLENLNLKYSEKYKIPIDSFKSYHEMNKIILSEEVFIEIQDLLRDDKQRTAKLKKQAQNDMVADGAVMALSMLPMGGFLAKVPAVSKMGLTQIHNGFKIASRNKAISEEAGDIAKMAYDFAKKSGNTKMGRLLRMKVVNQLSNESKRIALNTSLVSSAKRAVATKTVLSVKNSENALQNKSVEKKSDELFKVIDNKLEGRIGDFSNGMIAVYLQNIREVIKYNQAVINKKTTKL